jgi:hypothetical protein
MEREVGRRRVPLAAPRRRCPSCSGFWSVRKPQNPRWEGHLRGHATTRRRSGRRRVNCITAGSPGATRSTVGDCGFVRDDRTTFVVRVAVAAVGAVRARRPLAAVRAGSPLTQLHRAGREPAGPGESAPAPPSTCFVDVGIDSFAAIDSIALHCDEYSPWWSKTIRTARSRTSGGYGGRGFLFRSDIAPSSQGKEQSPIPGRFIPSDALCYDS